MIKVSTIKNNPNNPRTIDEDKLEKLKRSIKSFPEMMENRPMICVTDVDGKLYPLGGNMRLRAIKDLGMKEIPKYWVSMADEWTEEQRKEFIIKDNASLGDWNLEDLQENWDLDLISEWGVDLELDEDYGELGEEQNQTVKKLSDRFIIPPMSILDTKQGIWQQRKNYWLSLGIKSELGRDEGSTYSKSTQAPKFYEVKSELKDKGLPSDTDSVFDECIKRGYKLFGTENGSTSIFDPVLCELAYQWFNIPNGKILDSFAGGSVRGIVAAKLGYEYLGNDLSEKQIIANRINAEEVLKDAELYPTWTIGDSLKIDTIAKGYKADLLFSCPPYADLEVYSDVKEDISNMPYKDFINIYRDIIHKSCDLLNDDRFSVFVVGDVRDKKGFYQNFVSHTIQAFIDSGMLLYNEMILVNKIGSGAMRAGRQFSAGRKVVKHHQNVLVFYKGDPKKIKQNYPELDLSYIDEIDNTEDVDITNECN